MRNLFHHFAGSVLRAATNAIPDQVSIPVSQGDIDHILARTHKDYRPSDPFSTPLEMVLQFNPLNRTPQTSILLRGGWEQIDLAGDEPVDCPEYVVITHYTDYRGLNRMGVMIHPGHNHDPIQASKNPDARRATFAMSGTCLHDMFHVDKMMLPVFNAQRQMISLRSERLNENLVAAGLRFAQQTITQMIADQSPAYYSNFYDAGLRRDQTTHSLIDTGPMR